MTEGIVTDLRRCNCRICQWHQKRKGVLERNPKPSDDLKILLEIIDEMYDDLEVTSTELGMMKYREKFPEESDRP